MKNCYRTPPDAYLCFEKLTAAANDIKKQEDHSGPVSLPLDTIAINMGMAAIMNFES